MKHLSSLVKGAAVLAFALLVLAVALTAPTTAQAASGPTCFEKMTSGAQPQVIAFSSATYTVTVPTGTDVCLESEANLLLGFVGAAPFAVNGGGASGSGSSFLYAQGPVSGTLPFKVTAVTVVKLEITGVVGEKVTVWLGTLITTPATAATPPAATATAMQVVGPGSIAKTTKPEWEFTPVAGAPSMQFKLQSPKPFTPTTEIGGVYEPAASCGKDCFEANLPTNEGKIEAPELFGWWWTATLVGAPDARVLVPAPVQPTTTPSAGAVPPGGGSADGPAPNLWGATPPAIIGPTLPRGWGWALN